MISPMRKITLTIFISAALLAKPAIAEDELKPREQIVLDLQSLDEWALSNLLDPAVEQIGEFREQFRDISENATLDELRSLASRIRDFALSANLQGICTKTNQNLCTETELCLKATNNENGRRRWAEQTEPVFVAAARSRGLTCSVSQDSEPMSESMAIEYLMALTSYVSVNTSEFGLEFAERYNSVRPILAGSWSPELSQVFEAFRVYTNQNSGFFNHWEQMQEQSRFEQQARVAALREELSSKLTVLNEWALRNIIDPKAAEISTLIRDSEARDSQNENDLTYYIEQANAILLATGIGQQISESELTSEIEKILSRQSMYMIANLTPTATNMYVNLSGDLALYGATGNYCYVSALDALAKHLGTLEMESAFEGAKLSVSECDSRTDILFAMGSDLTRGEVVRDVPISDAYIVKEISPSDREQAIAKLAYDSQLIERDINSGSRIGYGIILFENRGANLCSLLTEDIDAHSSLIERQKSLLEIYSLDFAEFQLNSESVETIFRAIQRNDCGAVYATAGDLHNLSLAGQNNNFPTKFLPLWISERQVDASRNDIASAMQALANSQQSLADRARLNIEAQENLRTQAFVQQQRLRQTHDLEFRALNDRLKDLVEEAVNFAYETHPLDEKYEQKYSELRSLDPSSRVSAFDTVIKDMQIANSEGWEVSQMNLVREDFGEVRFAERSARGIISQIQIDLRNAIIGRYETYCRRIMLIDDRIFSTYRNIAVIDCGDTSSLRDWRFEQGFESLWVVSAQ